MKHEDYIRESKHKIDEVLTAFKIEHDIITAKSGPTVTLFEFTPNVGTKLSKLENLKREFALQLGVQAVRMIVPTERGTIGIEVPNRERVVIPMTEMLYEKEYETSDMALPIILGRKVDCNVFMADLAEMPHLLVAGATGMGKSVGLNVIISSLINKKSPDELKMILIDPKQVELTIYDAIKKPYLAKLHKDSEAIITEYDEAKATLAAVCEMMDQRYTKLKNESVRNIKEYNISCKKGYIDDKPMPYYVVIIDEYGDLVMQANGREMEKYICRIAQKARAVGIHMIISTQRPSTDVVTGNIKANFPTRIAFRTVTGTDSRVILDRIGAERLTGKGDMLFFNGGETTRVQCAFASTEETIELCHEVQEEYPEYEMVVLEKTIAPEVHHKFTHVHDETRRAATNIVKQRRHVVYIGEVYGNVREQLIEMGIIGDNKIVYPNRTEEINYHPVLVSSMAELNAILDTFYKED